jgi:hypothetical protein
MYITVTVLVSFLLLRLYYHFVNANVLRRREGKVVPHHVMKAHSRSGGELHSFSALNGG